MADGADVGVVGRVKWRGVTGVRGELLYSVAYGKEVNC